jgi:hypothetical protein
MGLLKRKNDSLIADAERELAALRERRASLATRLAATEGDLSGAIDARRRQLFEDGGGPVPNVVELMGLRDGLVDALAQIDGRIAEVEAKAAAERDRAARQAESELRTKQVERLREALRGHEATGKEVAEALAPLCPINFEIAGAAGNAKIWTNGVTVAVETAVARATVYVGAVAAGTVPIVTQPQPAKPAPPPPAPVERQTIYLLTDVMWPEPDGTMRYACCYGQASPPTDIARRAIKLNLADAFDSPRAVRLREIHGCPFSVPHPSTCTNLLTGEKPKPEADNGSSATPAEYVGPLQNGLAVVSPARW